MIDRSVLIEFTKSTCGHPVKSRMWTSAHLADIYVNRRKIAKILRKVPIAKT